MIPQSWKVLKNWFRSPGNPGISSFSDMEVVETALGFLWESHWIRGACIVSDKHRKFSLNRNRNFSVCANMYFFDSVDWVREGHPELVIQKVLLQQFTRVYRWDLHNLQLQAFLSMTRCLNFCSACAVTVVIFGHLNPSFYLLTLLLKNSPVEQNQKLQGGHFTLKVLESS